MPHKNLKEILEEEEISLLHLVRIFWLKRKFVYYAVAFFFVVGCFRAFTSSVEYTSKAKLLTEDKEVVGNSRGLAGLAGLAGVNVPDIPGSDVPDYISIAGSQPFLFSMIKEKFYSTELNKEVALEEYLTAPNRLSVFKKGLQYLKSLFSVTDHKNASLSSQQKHRLSEKAGIAILSSKEIAAINALKNHITVTPQGRFLTIEVRMPEPMMSAEVNQLVKSKLVSYVVDYKTVRRMRNVEFLEERTVEAKNNYTKAQMGLAGYQDRNLGLIVQAGRAREAQLQAQYNLYFNLYSSLASQLEQARIKLKEETPVFTDFEPVTIPQGPSGPNKIKIIVICVFLGAIIGVSAILAILFKEAFVHKYNQELNNKNIIEGRGTK